jgi:hypothetical protein
LRLEVVDLDGWVPVAAMEAEELIGLIAHCGRHQNKNIEVSLNFSL